MKKILSAILVFLLAFSLVGCLPNESDSSGNTSNVTESTASSANSEPQTSDTYSEPETSDTNSENGENSVPQYVDFDAQYIRSKTTHDDVRRPVMAVINSVEELSEYQGTIKDLFTRKRHDNPEPDFNFEAFDKYNAEFFENRALVVVFLQEGSGSIRHNIESVVNANGKMYINIRAIHPEICTADLAWWHIVTEIPKDKAPESAADVVIYHSILLDTEPLLPILNS